MPNTSKPLVIHMIPVFSAQAEAGWLIACGKKSVAYAKLLPSLGEEDASWEAPVRSWFVIDDRVQDAMDAVEHAPTKRDVVWCQVCKDGEPCRRWRRVVALGYRVRHEDMPPLNHPWPDIQLTFEALGPAQRKAARGRSSAKASNALFDEFEQVFRAFLGGFSEPRRAEKNSPVALAAGTLGIAWPCTADEVKKAHRVASIKNHPDHGGSTTKMAEINAARDLLLKVAS